MKSKKLLGLLEFESINIDKYFSNTSLLASTPQEIADLRENYFHNFISRYFPYPYRITKGQIMDSYELTSCSIDCIVINPAHPHTIDTKCKYSLILADGVDLAIELKPDLSKRNELETSLNQIRSVKKLRRRESPLLLRNGLNNDLLEFSKMIPTFIFTNKAKKNLNKTIQEIAGYYKKNNVPREEQFDFIVINQLGIISNYKFPETSLYHEEGEYKACYLYENWGEMTLARFVFLMNWVFHSTPTITEHILKDYLGKLFMDDPHHEDISKYFLEINIVE
ncbi:MAG: hypothetical protein ACD_20C00076G0003 [uncultured bacterium]|nr:MAG: hypothetical protein ACD_20C00076G0003 [uncultured bacterium]